MALVYAELLGEELMVNRDVMQALVSREKKFWSMTKRLQARSKRLATMYIFKNILIYYVRKVSMRFIPYSWIMSWHANAAKTNLIEGRSYEAHNNPI